MTEGYPGPASSEDESVLQERLAMHTREDWLAEVQRLEAQRERIQQATYDPELLAYDSDFNFLLGKISVAQRELRAHTVDETIAAIPDIQ